MKKIKLNHITKIEGHASLTLAVSDGKVKKCSLGSVEGSRYFEGLLKGRNCVEAPELTSRICGICSCIHTIVSIRAVENGLGISVSSQTKLLRELILLGERIRSHAAHLYFLALPDYLGYGSALAMGAKYKKYIGRGLSLTKLGNEIVSVVGGRDLHPVSAQVGGMTKVPSQKDIDLLKKTLKDAVSDGVSTAKLFLKLKQPAFENETEYFSLHDGVSVPVLEGDLVSASHRFKKKEYSKYIKEYHEPYSTANFVVKEGKQYMVGSLARLNNNHKFLSARAKKLAKGLKFPIVNPFYNNLAQAIEVVDNIDRAISICNQLKVKPEKIGKIKFKKCRGIGIGEAPRGILIHDYMIDAKGKITKADIITPTVHNLLNMQEDIRAFVPSVLKYSKKKIVLEVEKLIRAYDPCFSCSTHFLKVKWE